MASKSKGIVVGMELFEEKKKKDVKEKTAEEFFGTPAEGVADFDFTAILQAAEATNESSENNSASSSPKKESSGPATPITPLSAVPSSLRESLTGSGSNKAAASRDSVSSSISGMRNSAASVSSNSGKQKRMPTDDEVQAFVSLISQGAKRATIIAKIESDQLDPVETFAAIAFASISRPNGGSTRSDSPSRATGGRTSPTKSSESPGSLSFKGASGSNSMKGGSTSSKGGGKEDVSKASIEMNDFFSSSGQKTSKEDGLIAAFSSGKDNGEEFEMPTPFLAVAEEKMIAKMTEQQQASSKPSIASPSNGGGWFGTSFKLKPTTSPPAATEVTNVSTSPVLATTAKKNANLKPPPRPSKIPKDFSPANFGDMYGGGKGKDDDDFGFDNPLTKN